MKLKVCVLVIIASVHGFSASEFENQRHVTTVTCEGVVKVGNNIWANDQTVLFDSCEKKDNLGKSNQMTLIRPPLTTGAPSWQSRQALRTASLTGLLATAIANSLSVEVEYSIHEDAAGFSRRRIEDVYLIKGKKTTEAK